MEITMDRFSEGVYYYKSKNSKRYDYTEDAKNRYHYLLNKYGIEKIIRHKERSLQVVEKDNDKFSLKLYENGNIKRTGNQLPIIAELDEAYYNYYGAFGIIYGSSYLNMLHWFKYSRFELDKIDYIRSEKELESDNLIEITSEEYYEAEKQFNILQDKEGD